MLVAKIFKENIQEISIEACQKNKNIKKEISKTKIPHEEGFKWETKTTSKKLLCIKINK